MAQKKYLKLDYIYNLLDMFEQDAEEFGDEAIKETEAYKESSSSLRNAMYEIPYTDDLSEVGRRTVNSFVNSTSFALEVIPSKKSVERRLETLSANVPAKIITKDGKEHTLDDLLKGNIDARDIKDIKADREYTRKLKKYTYLMELAKGGTAFATKVSTRDRSLAYFVGVSEDLHNKLVKQYGGPDSTLYRASMAMIIAHEFDHARQGDLDPGDYTTGGKRNDKLTHGDKNILQDARINSKGFRFMRKEAMALFNVLGGVKSDSFGRFFPHVLLAHIFEQDRKSGRLPSEEVLSDPEKGTKAILDEFDRLLDSFTELHRELFNEDPPEKLVDSISKDPDFLREYALNIIKAGGPEKHLAGLQGEFGDYLDSEIKQGNIRSVKQLPKNSYLDVIHFIQNNMKGYEEARDNVMLVDVWSALINEMNKLLPQRKQSGGGGGGGP